MLEDLTRIGWRRGDAGDALLEREWLIGNGLGGYATGTLAGVCTRRYHGLLVAALPMVSWMPYSRLSRESGSSPRWKAMPSMMTLA